MLFQLLCLFVGCPIAALWFWRSTQRAREEIARTEELTGLKVVDPVAIPWMRLGLVAVATAVICTATKACGG